MELTHTPNTHLINRCCFGSKIDWLKHNHWLHLPLAELIQAIWETLPLYSPLPQKPNPQFLFPEDEEEERRICKQHKRDAYLANWIQSFVEQNNPLREVVALFWHHHIPCGPGHKPEHVHLMLEILRKHGLGPLQPLLINIAATPAMMYFLDGHHSHKNNPNENFARELLELFTLGEGHYTEKDVYEAARAFTGRRFDHDNYPYQMFIDEDAFDNGSKTFLGHTGHFKGEDIIGILLQQPATAKHIAKAILIFFGTENPLEEHIERCGQFYFDSGFHTGKLLRFIFEQNWFYEPPYLKNKVKTPVELLVSLQRLTGLKTIGVKTTTHFLRSCNQTLFFPPNVGGWPIGTSWLQGNALLYRLFLPGKLIKIANRETPKNSMNYKITSRISNPRLRAYRYFADALFDQNRLVNALRRFELSPAQWLGINKGQMPNVNLSLEDCLAHPDFQYS